MPLAAGRPCVQSSVGSRIRFERTALKTLTKKEMMARQGGKCAECGTDLKSGVLRPATTCPLRCRVSRSCWRVVAPQAFCREGTPSASTVKRCAAERVTPASCESFLRGESPSVTCGVRHMSASSPPPSHRGCCWCPPLPAWCGGGTSTLHPCATVWRRSSTTSLIVRSWGCLPSTLGCSPR